MEMEMEMETETETDGSDKGAYVRGEHAAHRDSRLQVWYASLSVGLVRSSLCSS